MPTTAVNLFKAALEGTKAPDADQSWTSFACEVSPVTGPQSHPQWFPIIPSILTPWRVYIDLTSIESSDVFLVQSELRIHAPNSLPRYTKDEQGYIWVLDDRLVVNARKVNSGEPESLVVNGNPIGFNKILSIEPMSGPWEARLSIAQIQGISKQLRFMWL